MIRLIRDGEKGGGGRDYIYTYHGYTVTTRMTLAALIKTGSDESHFNVSLIVRDKVTRQCPQTITFLKRKERRAKSSRGHSAYQPYGLRLGQTDSYPKVTCCHVGTQRGETPKAL